MFPSIKTFVPGDSSPFKYSQRGIRFMKSCPAVLWWTSSVGAQGSNDSFLIFLWILGIDFFSYLNQTAIQYIKYNHIFRIFGLQYSIQWTHEMLSISPLHSLFKQTTLTHHVVLNIMFMWQMKSDSWKLFTECIMLWWILSAEVQELRGILSHVCSLFTLWQSLLLLMDTTLLLNTIILMTY